AAMTIPEGTLASLRAAMTVPNEALALMRATANIQDGILAKEKLENKEGKEGSIDENLDQSEMHNNEL
ncbi:MAG: hypothetical protein Q8M58_06135, partial [Anaerolineales bacterium]|nr:hypothetical protein [Anaerolineales bacterium]